MKTDRLRQQIGKRHCRTGRYLYGLQKFDDELSKFPKDNAIDDRALGAESPKDRRATDAGLEHDM